MKLTDDAVIQEDLEALYIGNLNTVETDLTLPARGKHGSHICWKSEQEHYITSEGKVTRPSYGTGNRRVKLTAYLTYGNAAGEREFKITLLEKKKEIDVLEVYPIHLKGKAGEKRYLPFYVPVRTADSHLMHEVVWECGEAFHCRQSGAYEIAGYLKDRTRVDEESGAEIKIPATAFIHIEEHTTEREQEMNRKVQTKVISLADCGGQSHVALLGDNEFVKAQNRMLTFLLGTNADQMLYNFRRAAGLDTKNAPPMTGWDSPEGLVRGHTTGHYLSALALCFHSTGNQEILKKAQYMVEALGQCQTALSEQKGCQPGFLSAYLEEQFDLLEVYTPYPEIWAPYYTLHKILAGLLDCEKWAGIGQALEIADKIGEWIFRRLNRLSESQRMKMWSIYIAGEFGGINESLAELYLRTGKELHLRTAEMFDNDRLFLPMEMKQDALDGMHANQHIPQIIGAMKIYEASGEMRYYDMAKFFWQSVTSAHCYAIGGTGETEMFHGRDKIAGFLTENTAESCASYNMLKLTKLLYEYEPLASYMDYYERTMQNHILSSADKEPSGETVYFLPLGPGFSKKFERENTCCHGTGMENHFKYIESVYFQSEDTLYVNLFLESQVYWQSRGILVKQTVAEAHPGDITLYFKSENKACESEKWHLKIRQPYWCTGQAEIKVNGKERPCSPGSDGYLQFTIQAGEWDSEDREICIKIHFPCSLRMERTPDNPEIAALAYGPYVLAAVSDKRDYLNVPLKENELEEILIKGRNCISFQYGDIKFVPLYQISNEAYHVYLSVGSESNVKSA
ncbi:MAG: glycoside hydrolase family 127 protein [Muricomes sp.]